MHDREDDTDKTRIQGLLVTYSIIQNIISSEM